jgi:hypothetical protein
MRPVPKIAALFCILFARAEAEPGNAVYFMPKHPARRAIQSETSPNFTRKESIFQENQSGRISAVTPAEIAALRRQDAIHLGPFRIDTTTNSPIALDHGTTTTLAYPVHAIPGLDLVADLFTGHRDTRLGAPAGSAAITGGIRFHW